MTITKGHIIFAIVFAVVFLLVIAFLYMKDMKLHQKYYKGASKVVLAVIVIVLIFAVSVKKFMH